MKLSIDYILTLPRRAVRKLYYTLVKGKPTWDRFFRYRQPKQYWNKRGGERYFEEQEVAHDRTLRSEYIASQILKLKFESLVEIGCGYGKQLKNLLPSGAELAGCDFSRPQLLKSREYCPQVSAKIVEADAEAIPFQTKAFEAAFSSAVILHNEYPKAQKIVSEMIRISRRYLIHNEDTDITFSRYGYDFKKTYEKMGFKIIQSCQIPNAPEPENTQFTIAEIPPSFTCKPEDVPLQYH